MIHQLLAIATSMKLVAGRDQVAINPVQVAIASDPNVGNDLPLDKPPPAIDD